MNAQTKQQARTSEYSESALKALRCEVRDLKGQIASWKALVAARDIRRQEERRPVNYEWVWTYQDFLKHRRTDLRIAEEELRDMERAAVAARCVKRDEFRDTLLAVLRTRHDEDTWEQIKADARYLMEMTKEVSHG